VDITIESQVKNLYDQIQQTFGRTADALVNNAGSNAETVPLGGISWDNFTTVTSSHYLGAALMSKYFISSQPRPEDPVGTIVYITSGLTSMITPGFSSYAIAKMAGTRLIEYLDAEYPHLRAFSLSPGIVLTALTHETFKPFAKDHIDMPGMFTVYLSQKRADYLRGRYVGINWDIKEMEEHKEEIVKKNLLKMQWISAQLGAGGHPWDA
jgi:NAD(P)-dependent dehydrogenase (short-subunit alcohol dehydrogenase family)